MSETQSSHRQDVQSLFSRLQEIDSSTVLRDETVKGEVLNLARELAATLQGPVNRATDLAFSVRGWPIHLTVPH